MVWFYETAGVPAVNISTASKPLKVRSPGLAPKRPDEGDHFPKLVLLVDILPGGHR